MSEIIVFMYILINDTSLNDVEKDNKEYTLFYKWLAKKSVDNILSLKGSTRISRLNDIRNMVFYRSVRDEGVKYPKAKREAIKEFYKILINTRLRKETVLDFVIAPKYRTKAMLGYSVEDFTALLQEIDDDKKTVLLEAMLLNNLT